VRYKAYYKTQSFWFGRGSPRADRGISRPTGVFGTTIGVCKMLSRSVEIWQYEGQKPLFE